MSMYLQRSSVTAGLWCLRTTSVPVIKCQVWPDVLDISEMLRHAVVLGPGTLHVVNEWNQPTKPHRVHTDQPALKDSLWLDVFPSCLTKRAALMGPVYVSVLPWYSSPFNSLTKVSIVFGQSLLLRRTFYLFFIAFSSMKKVCCGMFLIKTPLTLSCTTYYIGELCFLCKLVISVCQLIDKDSCAATTSMYLCTREELTWSHGLELNRRILTLVLNVDWTSDISADARVREAARRWWYI